MLMDPKRLGHVVLVLPTGGVQAIGPFPDRGNDLIRRPCAQLDLGPVPDIVIGRLEELDQILDRRTPDLDRFEQRVKERSTRIIGRLLRGGYDGCLSSIGTFGTSQFACGHVALFR